MVAGGTSTSTHQNAGVFIVPETLTLDEYLVSLEEHRQDRLKWEREEQHKWLASPKTYDASAAKNSKRPPLLPA